MTNSELLWVGVLWNPVGQKHSLQKFCSEHNTWSGASLLSRISHCFLVARQYYVNNLSKQSNQFTVLITGQVTKMANLTNIKQSTGQTIYYVSHDTHSSVNCVRLYDLTLIFMSLIYNIRHNKYILQKYINDACKLQQYIMIITYKLQNETFHSNKVRNEISI